MSEAFAAVRAKRYDPVLSIAPKAVYVPHYPFSELKYNDVEGEAEGKDSEAGHVALISVHYRQITMMVNCMIFPGRARRMY